MCAMCKDVRTLVRVSRIEIDTCTRPLLQTFYISAYLCSLRASLHLSVDFAYLYTLRTRYCVTRVWHC